MTWPAAMYVMMSDAAQQMHPNSAGREGHVVRECVFREVHADCATARQLHPNPVGREVYVVRECVFREVHAGGATAQQTHPNSVGREVHVIRECVFKPFGRESHIVRECVFREVHAGGAGAGSLLEHWSYAQHQSAHPTQEPPVPRQAHRPPAS